MATVVANQTATHRAYQVLHFAFTIAPIIAGIDKYFDKLVNWDGYLAPLISRAIPAHTFMMVAGAIEIVAGLIVLFKPKVGGFIVGFWLLGIVVNLLIIPRFYDIALRDFGFALGAFALGFLAIDQEGVRLPSMNPPVTPVASPMAR